MDNYLKDYISYIIQRKYSLIALECAKI